MDLLALPVVDNSIDFVMCNHVLQDIMDDKKAMQEIFRVLKPSGKAVLQVPLSNKIENTIEHTGEISYRECEIRYGHRFHKRIYTLDDYIFRLSGVGFNVKIIEVSKNIDIYSINPKEKIILAIKPQDVN